jgi:DNA-binding NarL/FixJ family response regulator
MTVAILGRKNPNHRQLCGSELKSIFDSSQNPTPRHVTALFEAVESLSQLADELLKLCDYNLDRDGSDLHMRASRLARGIRSLHETAGQQHLTLHERTANAELSVAKTEECEDYKISSLTPRQREVLSLLVKGKSNKEIARILKLGEGTVKVHMSGLFRALAVHNRAGASFVGAQILQDAYVPAKRILTARGQAA